MPEEIESTEQLIRIALFDPEILRSKEASLSLSGRELSSADVQMFRDTMESSDVQARRRAVSLWCRLVPGARELLPSADKVLSDPVWTVREAAAMELPAVARALPDSAQTVHGHLTQATLYDKSSFVREAATQALLELTEQLNQTISVLRAALNDSRPPVRCRAATALSQCPSHADEFIDDLTELLDDPHQRVRRAVILVMPDLGSVALRAIPTLVKRRCEAAATIRLAAVASLRKLAPLASEQTRLILAPITNDDFDVQATLHSLTHPEVLDEAALEEFLQTCRRRAEWWSRLTPGATAATPKIETAWDAALAIGNLAAGADGNEAARQREFGWLLARLVEILMQQAELDSCEAE